MLSLLKCTSISEKIFTDTKTLEESRFKPQYFTRIRALPFQSVIKCLLSLNKGDTQTNLDNFFTLEGKENSVSQQAFSKARSKFDCSPFKKAFSAIVKAAYDGEQLPSLKRFHDKFLIAIDGSILALPNIPALHHSFGTIGKAPAARISMALDVLNDLVMDADIDKIEYGEREFALDHINHVEGLINLKDVIFLLDRGYPSWQLINWLSYKQSYFVMRVKNKFNNEFDALGIGSHIIEEPPDHERWRVRIIKLELDSGEIETLITNLFDLDEVEFKDLYFKRWSIETKYDVVKNKLELPNFTGFTRNVICQDFWISMYMLNIAAIAKYESDTLVQNERSEKNNKYQYQTNVNHMIGVLRGRFAKAVFFETEERKIKIIRDILQKIKRTVVPTNRDASKVERRNGRNAKFHHNKKHNL